jgi:hypothetical protein
MSDEHLDELVTRLLRAGRCEAPSAALQRRVARVMREPRRTSRWPRLQVAAAATVMALAAGTALLVRQGGETSVIAPEPFPTRSAEPLRATATPSAEPAPATPRKQPSPPVRSTPPTLAEEVASLQHARAALASGDAARCLRELDAYDRVVKGQKLRSEATLLRVEALTRAGQNEAAAALARRFAEHNPNDPLVDRARKLASQQSEAAGGQPERAEP